MAVPNIARTSRGPDRTALLYAGEGGPLFRLVLRGLLLTILTLGFYRFWYRARLRRYYWSAIRIANQPLEFTGTGIEMFLGFLIAVVALAVYLGLFQLLLAFAGIALWQQDRIALNLSVLAVLPLVYYASYRARRYILSRTRWRGIRFGMEKGAVDYALRALLYLLVAILTLGFLLPWAEFRLRKFATDRTFFGDLRFTQEGSWTGFLRPWLWVYAALVIVALGAFGLFRGPGSPGMVAVIVIGYVALVIALVHYSVAAWRYAASHTRLGDGVRFRSRIRTGRVLGIYVVGLLLVGLIVGAIGTALVAAAFGILEGLGGTGWADALSRGGREGAVPVQALLIGGSALLYLVIFLVAGALSEVLIAQPLLRHYVEEMTIEGLPELDRALQRPQDRMTEAEGIADALDVGAAF